VENKKRPRENGRKKPHQREYLTIQTKLVEVNLTFCGTSSVAGTFILKAFLPDHGGGQSMSLKARGEMKRLQGYKKSGIRKQYEDESHTTSELRHEEVEEKEW